MKIKKYADSNTSFYTLRLWIGILGLTLPFVVVIGGILQGLGVIEGSISSYYYTNMRDYFVGLLCVIGLYLVVYKGYDNFDKLITNLSGVFSLGIILFPTSNSGKPDPVGIFQLNSNISVIFHFLFASLFFLSLSYTSYFLFTKTDTKVMSKSKIIRNKIYRTCSVIMLVSIICIGIYFLLPKDTVISNIKPTLIFEALALLAFGVSWLYKANTFYRK
jgi:hypothetical protein